MSRDQILLKVRAIEKLASFIHSRNGKITESFVKYYLHYAVQVYANKPSYLADSIRHDLPF